MRLGCSRTTAARAEGPLVKLADRAGAGQSPTEPRRTLSGEERPGAALRASRSTTIARGAVPRGDACARSPKSKVISFQRSPVKRNSVRRDWHRFSLTIQVESKPHIWHENAHLEITLGSETDQFFLDSRTGILKTIYPLRTNQFDINLLA